MDYSAAAATTPSGLDDLPVAAAGGHFRPIPSTSASWRSGASPGPTLSSIRAMPTGTVSAERMRMLKASGGDGVAAAGNGGVTKRERYLPHITGPPLGVAWPALAGSW